MSEREPSYWAQIPANVRYDKSISANEKLLYGELTALTNKRGFCWASNEYFAELYQVHKKTVSQWISDLAAKGYIRVLIEDDAQKGKSRKIFMIYDVPPSYLESQDGEGIHEKTDTPSPQKDGDPLREKTDTSPQKDGEGHREKTEYNITVNNTVNKTTTTTTAPGGDCPSTKFTDAGALPWILKEYWGDKGRIPQITLKEKLMPILQEIGYDEMETCIKLVAVADRDKWNVRYLLGTIENRKKERANKAVDEAVGVKSGELGKVDFKCVNCGAEAVIPLKHLIKGRGRSFPCTECGTMHQVDSYLPKEMRVG